MSTIPQFQPATEQWNATVQRGGRQLGTYPVIGWAIFAGFVVEPMVYSPLLGRAVTVKDLSLHNSDLTGSERAVVQLVRL